MYDLKDRAIEVSFFVEEKVALLAAKFRELVIKIDRKVGA